MNDHKIDTPQNHHFNKKVRFLPILSLLSSGTIILTSSNVDYFLFFV